MRGNFQFALLMGLIAIGIGILAVVLIHATTLTGINQ
jgi:hypothetical protein